MIESFSFGTMNIMGRQYTSDLIIYPDGRVQDGWWRSRGHRLFKDDIADLVSRKPGVIIAGTGVNGRMKPDAGLRAYLENQGIAFLAGVNDVAVKWYNEQKGAGNVGACFHLTC